MSNLVAHAEEELKRARLMDPESDYNGMIGRAVLELVKAHAAQGHSGMSSAWTLKVFNRIVNFKTLTPITDDPAEWMEIGRNMLPPAQEDALAAGAQVFQIVSAAPSGPAFRVVELRRVEKREYSVEEVPVP